MKKLYWFLGEFFVVVAGVLVAFLLNGWWESIKEHKKEENYLRYIHRDITSSIGMVGEAKELQNRSLHAASMVLSSLHATAPMPDSLLGVYILRAMSFAPSTQVSATLSSLVSTGDLELIADDSLRRSLSELHARLKLYEQSTERMASQWLIPAYERFADASRLVDLRYQLFDESSLVTIGRDSLTGFTEFDNLSLPMPVQVQELLDEEAFRSSILKLHVAQQNLYYQHFAILQDMDRALSILEHHMDMRGLQYDDASEVKALVPE